MFSKQIKALTVVLLTMAVATPEMAVPAAAFLPAQSGSGGNSSLKLDSSNLLTEVESDFYWRRFGSNRYYGGNRHYYGHGYNNYNHGYNNYNNGWHYRRHHHDYWPYYGLAFGLGYGFGGYGYNDAYYGNRYYSGGDHVQWCLNRYRSYNPRTDMFMGYDGHRHRCNSPY